MKYAQQLIAAIITREQRPWLIDGIVLLLLVVVFVFILFLIISRSRKRLAVQVEKRTAELLEANKAAEKANRAKSEFLANMSHEMRTPLNAVLGLTDLILEDDKSLSGDTHDKLIKIKNASATLLSIVNDILDISKIQSGKLELITVEYETASLINDAVTFNMLRLENKPIEFRLNINGDLPRRLHGDELRVKQILNNLISNAIKYTHKGIVELCISCKREGEYQWMNITVNDTGIGIRKENINKLFTDYNQVDTLANRTIEGTGLGLSITKKLTELMNGGIIVESEYGKGTTFRVHIRQGYAGDKSIGQELANELCTFKYTEDKKKASKKFIRADLSFARVLVIDDMPTNLFVAASLMRKYKMQVDCLTTGKEAIEKIKEGKPVYNVIFMDHMMPEMDGIETTRLIRELGTEYAKTIPIIALTANAVVGSDKMFLEKGFQTFISKPIDIMKLDAILMQWIKDKPRRDIPGVDVQTGLALYGGNFEIYLHVLRSFVLNAMMVIKKLSNVSEETLKDYAVNAQGLKGICASIGAEKTREAAYSAELKAKSGDLSGVLAENEELIKEAEILASGVQTWLEEHDSMNPKPRLARPDPAILARLKKSCESYDINGIDDTMDKLEGASYDNDAELVRWLREKINSMDLSAIAARLNEYGEGSL